MALVISPDVTPNLGSKTKVTGDYSINNQTTLNQALYPKDILVVSHKVSIKGEQIPIVKLEGAVKLRNTTSEAVPNSRLTVQVIIRTPSGENLPFVDRIVVETGPIPAKGQISFSLPPVQVPEELVAQVIETNTFLINFRCRTPTDVIRFARTFPIDKNQTFDLEPVDYSGVITDQNENVLFTMIGSEVTEEQFTREYTSSDAFKLTVKIGGVTFLEKSTQLNITPAQVTSDLVLENVELAQPYVPGLLVSADTSQVLDPNETNLIPLTLSIRPDPSFSLAVVDYEAKVNFSFSSYTKTLTSTVINDIDFEVVDQQAIILRFSTTNKSGSFDLAINAKYDAERLLPDGTRTLITGQETLLPFSFSQPLQNPGWPPHASLDLSEVSPLVIKSAKLQGQEYPSFPSQEVLMTGAVVNYPLELNLEYPFNVEINTQVIGIAISPILNGVKYEFLFDFVIEQPVDLSQYLMYSRADVFGGPNFDLAVPVGTTSIKLFDSQLNEIISLYNDPRIDLPTVTIDPAKRSYSGFLDDLFNLSTEASYAIAVAVFLEVNPELRNAKFVNLESGLSPLNGVLLNEILSQILAVQGNSGPPEFGGLLLDRGFEIVYSLLYQNLRYDRTNPPTNIELA